MAYAGSSIRIPFDLTGFTFARDSKLAFQTALVDGTRNVNFHEGGVGKRGGTTPILSTPTDVTEVRGLFDFRTQSGAQNHLFAKASGKLYLNAESTTLKTGMSTNNRYNFSVFDNQCYIADGASIPQVLSDGAGSTVDISGIATDWSGTGPYPFQIVPHATGANARMWAIRSDAVYASKNGDGDDFSDAEVKKIPVYSLGGLVGGIDFGGKLIVFSKTQAFIIDDTSADTADWGYQEAIWEGGVAHWRLIVKAANNLFLMTEEGLIYTIRGVQATGDYEQANITRPAHIDRFIQTKVNLTNIEQFHASYDRKLRAIKWFVQVGGSNTNTAIVQFIDRPPELAWAIHDNQDNASGYNASISGSFRNATGDYRIFTGDPSGQLWKLEGTSKVDDEAAIKGAIKTKENDFGNSKEFKHFRNGRIRAAAEGNFDLTIRVYIDGIRKEDIALSLSGSGAVFGTATFNTSVFAEESIEATDFDLGYYGYDIQFEIFNETANQDFFVTELSLNIKSMGLR